MNIRFPNAFDTIPASVQGIPAAIRQANSRVRLIASLLGVVALVGAVWVLLQLFSKSPEQHKPVPPVYVAKVRATNVTVVEHTLGTVVANATVQVTARVTGQLLSASFKEGDVVHAGDLLFQIDPRPFEASLQQARAQLAKDEASLANANANERRFIALFKQAAVSSQQRDEAVATAKEFAATVQSDRAAVQMAMLNLGYTRIRSPIDGKTGPILIQPGNLVTAGGATNNAGSGASQSSTTSGSGSNPLVVITQFQPVKVSFSLPQADLPRIQARQSENGLVVAIDLHNSGAKPLVAPVDFVGNAVSAQTGTIELRATFANEDMRLVPGQLVDVAVALNTLQNAMVVPREAVNVGPESRYVYRVTNDSKAEMKDVKVLFDGGNFIAISGDIRPGDRVITDGQLRVQPGSTVAVERKGAARKAS
jgi:multidrug efflux system membrane fusion protein